MRAASSARSTTALDVLVGEWRFLGESSVGGTAHDDSLGLELVS